MGFGIEIKRRAKEEVWLGRKLGFCERCKFVIVMFFFSTAF